MVGKTQKACRTNITFLRKVLSLPVVTYPTIKTEIQVWKIGGEGVEVIAHVMADVWLMWAATGSSLLPFNLLA